MLLRVLLVAMLSAVTVPPASARTDPQERCQDAIAGAGRMLLDRSLTILAACHHAVARGALPAGTVCLDRRQTRRRLDQAAREPEHRIRRACSDAVVAALRPAGDCDGAGTVAALTACLRASHEGEAANLVGVASAADDQLGAPARRCEAKAFEQVRRAVTVRQRSLQRCKSRPDGYQLPVGGACGDAAVVMQRDAALQAKAARAITAACNAAGLTGRPIGAPCDDVVRRILRAQLCFRLDSDPPRADPTQVETPAHLDVALAAAREGIVLLRNEHAALPLDRSAVHSIVVVGALAAQANIGDHGSSDVAPTSVVTALDGIRASAGGIAVTYIAGPAFSAADQAAISAADAAVVVAGLTSADEGEGLITIGDRLSMGLPRGQDDVVAAVGALNSRTVVVLEGGSAITMPWVGDVAAVLMAWYPGERGGTAIADVLFGDVNPSGKLPVTFPVAEADLPPFDNVSSQVTYGFLHGYRWVDQRGTAPLFPFGFGLSYTTFRYANLRLDASSMSPQGRVRVTADVTNTGGVAGDEVAQLYVGYRGSGVERAPRDLKGFARVHLEPGETRAVAFTLRAADVAFWDVSTPGWNVEPITYEVAVGSSSRDLPLSGTFSVKD